MADSPKLLDPIDLRSPRPSQSEVGSSQTVTTDTEDGEDAQRASPEVLRDRTFKDSVHGWSEWSESARVVARRVALTRRSF